MVFDLDFAARTDVGLVRAHNQDVARVVPELGLALVADGMGGHANGDVASRTAVQAFERNFAREVPAGADGTVDRVEAAFREANRRIAEHPMADASSQMGTTLVAAAFANGRVVVGNVGDSRCYRLHGGKLELLTEDHSYAGELQRGGASPTRAVNDAIQRWGHMLTRCLNGNEDVEADARIVPAEPGDVYLLCSDGLWGMASESALRRILESTQSADEACDHLLTAARNGGGQDNIGVAVVRLEPLHARLGNPPWQQSNESLDAP